MMKSDRNIAGILGFYLVFVLSQIHAESMSRSQIIAAGESMMDAQIALFEKANKYPQADWEAGVLWVGMVDFAKVSNKPEYFETIVKSGEAKHWTPIVSCPEVAARLTRYWHNADDLCIGQGWLQAYEKTRDPKILAPIQKRIEQASDYIMLDAGDLKKEDQQKGDLRIWTWCDALFMMPPVNAQLSALTGNPKYRNAMHIEWWRASAVMYDESEHLYFRDEYKVFPKKKTLSGKKIFWSRGNGWVLAGLARVLEYLPKDDPVRPRYEKQMQEMAARLIELQRTDGTWSPSLLDYEEFPYSDSSGTALNCFAMSWGVNHEVLDRKTYLPAIEKAWSALLAARRDDGLLGYVQGVAHGPADTVYADGNRTYGTGAFLMATAQLAELAPLEVPPSPELKAKVKARQ